MIDIYYQVTLYLNLAAGLFCLLLGFIGRAPSGWSVLSLGLSELSLLVQLVLSIALVAQGAQAKQDTVEYFAYLITALLVPVGAVLWALLERSKWSTVVLGVAALAVAVMLVRMHQIWTGIYV
jgi:hypothetical protein